MLKIKYLSEAQLVGFEKYKYNCVDHSVLSRYIMHPFWDFCVQFCPQWIAPNLITFTGFLLTLLNFLVIGYYDYDFTAANEEVNPIPRWMWLVATINLFVAYTLDGIDGKQARRTGTSSPLGELFDHGLDSYSITFITVVMLSLFGRIDVTPIRLFFLMWNVFLQFYLSHVEKYNTGVLFLPYAYDVTMWGVSLQLFLAWVLGAQVWRMKLPGGLTPGRLTEVTLYIAAILSSYPIILYNVYRSYKDGTGKMRTLPEALRPLYPFVSLFVISTLWILLSKNDIFSLELRLIIVLLGTVFSNISCRLIVAQMTDTRTDGWNIFMWPILIGALVSIFPYSIFGFANMSARAEQWIVYVLTAGATLTHIHYGQGLVREMCDRFKIKCFTIPQRTQQL